MVKTRRGSGEGSIYRHETRRADGSVRVRYRFVLDGRTYTFRTLREATAKAKELLAERALGVRRDDTLRAGAFLDQWFREVKAIEGMAPSTLIVYRSYLDRIVIPYLAGTRLADVSTPQIQRLLASLVATPYSASTVQVIRGMLSGAFEYARRSRLIAVNPVRDTVAPRIERPRKLAPTPADAVALRDLFPDPPWQAFVVIGLCYGLRISEILGLRWSDCTDTTITVRGQLGRNGGDWTPRRKVDDDLELAMVAPVARALIRHRAVLGVQPGSSGGNSGDLIFTRPDGRPYTQQQAYDEFRKRVRGSGLPFRTPHDMRHANNSLADELGIDTATRMAVLGHRSAVINQGYSHTNAERTRVALQRIAAVIGE